MAADPKRIQETSPASAVTAVGGTFENLDQFDTMLVVAVLTGATGGALDVYLQCWDGVDWVDYSHYPQITAGAAAATYAIPMARVWPGSVPTVVGRNTTPALTVNKSVGGDWGSKMRILYVAGAGTSAGAAQDFRIIGNKLAR